jgi:AcrR family transcriptional regulator
VFHNGTSDVKYAERMSTEGLPAPPRLPRAVGGVPGRTPRQRTLSQEAIVDAAMAILDEGGLDALTMRAVAAALGTGAASLYAHVASKDVLIELLIERVIGEIRFEGPPDPARWVEQLQETGREMRRMWARHKDLARASFSRIPLGENALRGSEWMIAVMRAGGLSDRAIGLGCDLMALYIGAVAYEESIGPAEGVGPAEMEEYASRMQDYFAALPADRFPGLVSLAGSLTEADGEERFEFGLEVLIRGLIAVSGSAG